MYLNKTIAWNKKSSYLMGKYITLMVVYTQFLIWEQISVVVACIVDKAGVLELSLAGILGRTLDGGDWSKSIRETWG